MRNRIAHISRRDARILGASSLAALSAPRIARAQADKKATKLRVAKAVDLKILDQKPDLTKFLTEKYLPSA